MHVYYLEKSARCRRGGQNKLNVDALFTEMKGKTLQGFKSHVYTYR